MILAGLYCLAPLFNTVAGSLVSHLNYWAYLEAMFADNNWLTFVIVFALYPLAGLSIFAMKNWSFALYLMGVQASFRNSVPGPVSGPIPSNSMHNVESFRGWSFHKDFE